METLHITTPADLVSLIGHSLGYWPHESLVCISLQENKMAQPSGSTCPPHPTTPTCTHEKSADTSAATRTRRPPSSRDNDSEALFGPLVEVLAQQLALAGMPIRASWIVRPTSIANFRVHPFSYGPDIPLTTVRSSLLNAEIIFRGSQRQRPRPPPPDRHD
jgi:hypothetical protein